MSTTASVLEMPEFDAEVFKETILEIRVPAFNRLVFVFKDGTSVGHVWEDKSRRDSWSAEMRAKAAEHAKRRYINE